MRMMSPGLSTCSGSSCSRNRSAEPSCTRPSVISGTGDRSWLNRRRPSLTALRISARFSAAFSAAVFRATTAAMESPPPAPAGASVGTDMSARGTLSAQRGRHSHALRMGSCRGAQAEPLYMKRKVRGTTCETAQGQVRVRVRVRDVVNDTHDQEGAGPATRDTHAARTRRPVRVEISPHAPFCPARTS